MTLPAILSYVVAYLTLILALGVLVVLLVARGRDARP